MVAAVVEVMEPVMSSSLLTLISTNWFYKVTMFGLLRYFEIQFTEMCNAWCVCLVFFLDWSCIFHIKKDSMSEFLLFLFSNAILNFDILSRLLLVTHGRNKVKTNSELDIYISKQNIINNSRNIF